MTILYVSHEFGAVEHFVERLVLVRGGIVFDGPPAELSPASGTTPRTSMLELEFMRLAFAAGAVVGVLAPAVGFFLVQRQLSLIGDGIGHVAFAGVALGYLLGISPVLTALVASVVGGGRDRVAARAGAAAGDQALALVFYTGIAAGVVLVSAAGALNVNLFEFLFGSILTVTRAGPRRVARLGVAGLASIALLYRALVAVVLDEEGARVAGVPVAALNVALAVLAAVTVAVSMRIVGILLIAALMVLPGDRRDTDRLEHALDAPALDGDRPRRRCSCGLTASYYADLRPAGRSCSSLRRPSLSRHCWEAYAAPEARKCSIVARTPSASDVRGSGPTRRSRRFACERLRERELALVPEHLARDRGRGGLDRVDDLLHRRRHAREVRDVRAVRRRACGERERATDVGGEVVLRRPSVARSCEPSPRAAASIASDGPDVSPWSRPGP